VSNGYSYSSGSGLWVLVPYFQGCEAQMMPLRKSIQMTGTTKTGLVYQGVMGCFLSTLSCSC
jgi:hypothetical protein